MSFQPLTEEQRKAVIDAGRKLAVIGETLAENPDHLHVAISGSLMYQLAGKFIDAVGMPLSVHLNNKDVEVADQRYEELLEEIPARLAPI